MKQFNISGPNDPARHYTLPALRRLGDVDVMELMKNLKKTPPSRSFPTTSRRLKRC